MPKSPLPNCFEAALAKRPAALRRTQPPAFSGSDFASNDYLGLGALPVEITGPLGATGSRLLSGTHADMLALEKSLAQFHGSDTSLVFPSAYQANLALIQSIVEAGGILLVDKHVHASIIDGARMAGVAAHRFIHNRIDDLEKQLHALGTDQPVFVVTESVFSIRGDMANLVQIADVCEANDAQLIVDEAHACGWMQGGRGLVEALGLESKVAARTLGFGKAWGAQGGAVLCTQAHKQWMLNSSRALVYSTAVSPAWCKVLALRLDQVAKANNARAALKKWMDTWAAATGYDAGTPIQFVAAVSNEGAVEQSEKLLELGMRALPIRIPTAPGGQPGLRINLRANHSLVELTALTTWMDTYVVPPISRL